MGSIALFAAGKYASILQGTQSLTHVETHAEAFADAIRIIMIATGFSERPNKFTLHEE
jgi:hypothetical protein